ncbi:MAG TPA: NAD-dependent epimerase/dehydratase family protein [Bacilli bacterium]
MKVLITGATGFVGSNLARALVNIPDMKVSITVRHDTDFWRIGDIRSAFVQTYAVDLSDRDAVDNLVQRVEPDVVYHAASYGGFSSQNDPEQMIRTNLSALIHLIDASAANGVKHFINTGSSSEYGMKNSPMKEEDSCFPLSLYGITKLAATQYCSNVGIAQAALPTNPTSSASGMKVCTLRLFSPYGPNEDPSRLYPSIISALSRDQRPKLSRPDSVRDFIPIETVVQIYLQILQTDYPSGAVINVGSGKQQTIARFYNQIALQLGKADIEPIWGETPPRANEPLMWEADTTKLKSLFPWMK